METHRSKPTRALTWVLGILFIILMIGLFVANAFVNAFTVHQENGWHPAWSPDGRYIAFASNYPGCRYIYRVDADGTNRIQLTVSRLQFILFPCSVDSDPAWSPDGREIAFVSQRKSFPWNRALGIDVMNADGSGIRRLTKQGGNSILDSLSECAHPTWSPDGKMIAFVCQHIDDNEFDSGLPALYLMNADGSNLHKVVDINTNLGELPGSSPSWSPDSRSLIFLQDEQDNLSAVYRVNTDGSALKRLSRRFIMFSNAAWSPDGSTILFIARDTLTNPAADEYFYTMNANGSHITQVARFHGQSFAYVSWSPDGKRIAFDDGAYTLYVMNTDGTGLMPLTKCCPY